MLIRWNGDASSAPAARCTVKQAQLALTRGASACMQLQSFNVCVAVNTEGKLPKLTEARLHANHTTGTKVTTERRTADGGKEVQPDVLEVA